MSPQSLYSRVRNSLASHTTHSLRAYASMGSDPVRFESYPPIVFEDPNTFASVLRELDTNFAIQASNQYIQAIIDSTQRYEREVYLDSVYCVRIVDTAVQLAFDPYQFAAFIRTDKSLALWGNDEEFVLSTWTDVITRIQNLFGSVTPNSTLMAGPSAFGYIEGLEGSDSLPPLNELSALATVVGPTAPSLMVSHASSESYLSSLLPWTQSESLDYELVFNPSPSSTLDSPLTGDFGNISLYPAPLVGPSDISPEMTVITSDGEGSPAVSNSSSTRSGNPPLAQGMSSFRRHSIGEASALSVCAIVQKTKRGVSEEDVSFEVKGEADVHHGLVSGAGVYKHSRSVMGVSAASAPAIFSVPLPEVEQGSDDAETGSVDRNSSEPFDDLAFGSPAPSSIPSPAPSIPAPAFDSAPATSSSTSGQRRPRARRRSGATSRQKRTPCEYCTKTFSRIQDAQRHIATSCNASPKKMGVECPKCGSVLSRLDAAQRHWRQNRACAPPEWADHA